MLDVGRAIVERATRGLVKFVCDAKGRILGAHAVCPDASSLIETIVLARKQGVRIGEIARAVKGARHLYLATDPDREGEAISWHLVAALKELGASNGVDVKRVVFHEVTRRAVLEAMQHPRDLDIGLIDAYQARRALDYLVGFNLSPLLWKKIRRGLSAGRVQSVATRLVVERERERMAFRSASYWDVDAELTPELEAGIEERLRERRADRRLLADPLDGERA